MAKNKEILAKTLPLVALDLGSNGIRAMAAEQVEDSLSFRVLGVEELNEHSNAIDRGVVMQSENVAYTIGKLLRLLANRIGVNELPAAFVSVGGRSMKVAQVHAERDLVHKSVITQAILDELKAETIAKIESHYQDFTVVGVIPAFYRLDNIEQINPPSIEQTAVMVAVYYSVFIINKNWQTQFAKSFAQSGKSIEQTFVRQDVLLSAFAEADGLNVLNDGCALIDFGADTTTLSIFKQTEYLYTRVQPQGGRHITRVIEDQGMSFACAEAIKQNYGIASTKYVNEKDVQTLIYPATQLNVSKGRISTVTVASLIEGKLCEILDPLLDEIRPYENRIKTIYITGGASTLTGLVEYIQDRTPLQVLYGSHSRLLKNSGAELEKYEHPKYSALVGTLLMGADYRKHHPGNTLPPTKWGKKLTKAVDAVVGIFSFPQ